MIVMYAAAESGYRYKKVSLDHDLGEDEINPETDRPYTGYDVVLWLEFMAMKDRWDVVPEYINVHSANPVGLRKMEAGIAQIEKLRKITNRG